MFKRRKELHIFVLYFVIYILYFVFMYLALYLKRQPQVGAVGHFPLLEECPYGGPAQVANTDEHPTRSSSLV